MTLVLYPLCFGIGLKSTQVAEGAVMRKCTAPSINAPLEFSPFQRLIPDKEHG